MPMTLDDYLGGAVEVTAGGTITLSWGDRRRFQMINPTVASPTVNLPPASGKEFTPDLGMYAFVLVNVNGANSFVLDDTEGFVTETVAVGQAAIISRVLRPDGSFRFDASLATVL